MRAVHPEARPSLGFAMQVNLFPLKQRPSLLTFLTPSFVGPEDDHKMNSVPPTTKTLLQEGMQTGGQATFTCADTSYHEHTPFALDFSELMVPSDLDFLK